jgi:hypothetical protein
MLPLILLCQIRIHKPHCHLLFKSGHDKFLDRGEQRFTVFRRLHTVSHAISNHQKRLSILQIPNIKIVSRYHIFLAGKSTGGSLNAERRRWNNAMQPRMRMPLAER